MKTKVNQKEIYSLHHNKPISKSFKRIYNKLEIWYLKKFYNN